jgi:cysteinyl-tRNA synthetase
MSKGLTLYNTLTRTKEAFSPVDPDNVRMYVCGPTVYDYAHIGNARPIIVFDVLYRLLRHLYGVEHVTYARNITDVDDKINARAARDYPDLPLNEAIRKVTQTTEAQFKADARALGCLEPDVEPRATEHIEEMRQIIERLIARGAAYVAEDHVLFSVTSMEKLPNVPRYGSLARRSLDEMLAGARVDVAPYKRDAMDFVLWKPSNEGEPGWPSPGGIDGLGRPGWHIECSAMAWKHLIEAFDTRIRCDEADRNVFDIHGGGIDLVFPHHENEIAQSCCAFETGQMAKVWMHNGFLQVEGEKMSKSLGNFITIHELLETEKFGGRRWPGEVLRLAMLKTHYRQPIDWTVRALEEAEANLQAWHAAEGISDTGDAAAPSAAVLDSFADDLNAAEAIMELHRLRKIGDVGTLAENLRFLGLFNPKVFARSAGGEAISPELQEQVESLIAARREARAARNWAESDRIRDELAAMGVTLKDNKDGTTTWEVTR